jgi:hypothetical protein
VDAQVKRAEDKPTGKSSALSVYSVAAPPESGQGFKRLSAFAFLIAFKLIGTRKLTEAWFLVLPG